MPERLLWSGLDKAHEPSGPFRDDSERPAVPFFAEGVHVLVYVHALKGALHLAVRGRGYLLKGGDRRGLVGYRLRARALFEIAPALSPCRLGRERVGALRYIAGCGYRSAARAAPPANGPQ